MFRLVLDGVPGTDPADRPTRAPRLSPDERRDAILRAVRPVLLERGVRVTTRELADAAGVAEGTLFRVFDSKQALLREAALAAVGPGIEPVLAEDISPDLPLEERLEGVVEAMLGRMQVLGQWMSVLHEIGRPGADEAPTQAPTDERGPAGSARASHPGPHGPWAQRRAQVDARTRELLTRALQPDADRLCTGVEKAVDVLQILVIGSAMRGIAARGGASVADLPARLLVQTFLHGLLGPAPPDEPGPDDPTTPDLGEPHVDAPAA